MPKPVALTADDLAPRPKDAPASATRQRGEATPPPSAALVPMQFKMPPEFVRDFKIEAARRGMKLNALLKALFDESMKA